MVPQRSLPNTRNPLIAPEHTPPVEILVERRRLGQTDLTVSPGQVGLTNATKAKNLGHFDYAHLRVPLPENLKGSEIFTSQGSAPGREAIYPESYFLMRRSHDGHISATGMFKAAFPWASLHEEHNEREHQKTLPSADKEEIAGNVWISPEDALSLADEYGLRTWIIALLDPEPIHKNSKDKVKKDIATPPKFDTTKLSAMSTPAGSTRRKRDLRSASPSKMAPPPQSQRKIASPRKSRRGRPPAVKNEEATSIEDMTPATSVAPESVNGEVVTVETDQRVEVDGTEEVTHTDVKITMPANAPDLPLPTSPEEMVATAQRMVDEANKLDSKSTKTPRTLKRKAAEVEDAEAQREAETKRLRKAEEEVKKQRVRNRALIGITGVAAIGAVLPYFTPYFTFSLPF